MHRVVLQQVGQRGGVGQIVDGHEVDVLVLHGGAHDVAADAPEPVDADFHCHRLTSEYQRTVKNMEKSNKIRL